MHLPQFLPGSTRRERAVVGAALLLTLVLLLAHAAAYWFLTDDAYISFRYARNLAHGHGLVFNPGGERVEGYTDFLWVLLLAGADRLGLRPEHAAGPLGLAATIVLWILVVRFALRTAPAGRAAWPVVIPPLLLAATRSVAVWSSGGLETRLFEVLILGGVFRLVTEVEAEIDGPRPRAPASSALFALATLTRPDGLVIAATAIAAAGGWLLARRRLRAPAFALRVATYALPVLAHLAFRRLYYGDWLPNTYYVKIDGRTWWSMGATYLAAFAIEYAAFLWIPLLIAAIVFHVRRRTGFVPLLFLSVVVLQAGYVASVGGDHFEYRPLDVLFPLVFLLIGDGARALAARRRGAAMAGGAVAAILAGLVVLPLASHRQFPEGYRPGFPGLALADPARRAFLDPDRDALTRLPGMRALALEHRALLRRMTSEFVGLRQEEHRAFLATVVPEGRRLALLVRRGAIAPDAYLAICCVGAIPYLSHLPVLDRLGLTDRTVAHSPPTGSLMAHSKHATLRYAMERGVDLWAMDEVHALLRADDPRLYEILAQVKTVGDAVPFPIVVADAGDGWYLVGALPRGLERTAARFPGLRLLRATDAEVVRPIFEAGLRTFRRRAREAPPGGRARVEYAALLEHAGEYDAAFDAWQAVGRPGDPEVLLGMARSLDGQGDARGALRYVSQAVRAVPEDPVALYQLAQTLTKAGDYRRAVEAYRALVRLHPQEPGLHLRLGEAYLAAGEIAAAARECVVLDGLDPGAAARLRAALPR